MSVIDHRNKELTKKNIDKEILKNIDIDMAILENTNTDILENIDIKKEFCKISISIKYRID